MQDGASGRLCVCLIISSCSSNAMRWDAETEGCIMLVAPPSQQSQENSLPDKLTGEDETSNTGHVPASELMPPAVAHGCSCQAYASCKALSSSSIAAEYCGLR